MVSLAAVGVASCVRTLRTSAAVTLSVTVAVTWRLSQAAIPAL